MEQLSGSARRARGRSRSWPRPVGGQARSRRARRGAAMSGRAPSSSGEERFWKLANPLLTQAGVTRSTMMGFPCLRLAGDFFASCDRGTGHLVIKLNEARATALIEAGRAEPFAPNGRPFREWVSIPERFARSWPTLLDEALRCSAERKSARRVSRPPWSAKTLSVRA